MPQDSATPGEILKANVAEFVKEFIKREGAITPYDLEVLFGPGSPANLNEVATALAQLSISRQ
jgi:hypothetical protein